MEQHEQFMYRCLALARLGAGYVAPNPMVGAVLVNNDRIIGEGYHQQYGKAHAEVNCLNNVSEDDRHLIPSSTLYVSLEPCAHFGKTPPCADLIIQHKINNVFIGCRDPFALVDGQGLEKLEQAGVTVRFGLLEKECKLINQAFFVFHQQQRPFIVLKWAESGNKMIGRLSGEAIKISNQHTDRLVHKWRSECAAILVGTRTALNDNPHLNNRYWSGPNPVRLVVDLKLRLPTSLNVFDGKQSTIILNTLRSDVDGAVRYYQLDEKKSLPMQIAEAAYQLGLQSILIEGGQLLLQTFIDAGLWDEARVIENRALMIDDGVKAPTLHHQVLLTSEPIFDDYLSYYRNKQSVALSAYE